MFFLNKATVVEQKVRTVLLSHGSTTYKELVVCLKNLEELRQRFAVEVDEKSTGASPISHVARKDLHEGPQHVDRKIENLTDSLA